MICVSIYSDCSIYVLLYIKIFYLSKGGKTLAEQAVVDMLLSEVSSVQLLHELKLIHCLH